MPNVIQLQWDSRIFRCRVGKVSDYNNIPSYEELSSFKFAHVRIPQDQITIASKYEELGFRYILVDYLFEKTPVQSKPDYTSSSDIVLLTKERPSFHINGFKIGGSRLSIDPGLSSRLKDNFWDEVIYEHCSEYADFALCALTAQRNLIGFASCFNAPNAIDMFLLIVHPHYRHNGIGTALINHAENLAYKDGKNLTTSVVSSNYDAINFYFKNGFKIRTGYIVMHFSNTKVD